jgi:hypothetical protein
MRIVAARAVAQSHRREQTLHFADPAIAWPDGDLVVNSVGEWIGDECLPFHETVMSAGLADTGGSISSRMAPACVSDVSDRSRHVQ